MVYWPFQGGTSFVDLLCFSCLVFAMPLCASVCMCLVVTCWQKTDLLALVCGVLLWVCHFPIGILGQVWYLIIFAPLLTFISFKDVIILSICISWSNFFMLSTLFLTCFKSPHSKRKWRTVNGASQSTHCGCSSPCSKYEWVTLVWPQRSRAKTTSSFLMFQTTDWCLPLCFISQ